MLQDFLDHIERYKLFAKTDRILVAVSGGRDSMALAHLFLRSGLDFALAHANFQLRGAASEADENLVKTWAKENGVVCYRQRFDTRQYAQEEGLSTQLAARELRYEWFDELCEAEGFEVVATAHHRQDALESTLLHLARGTGHAGMVGISPYFGRRVRPLLFATRNQIDAYVGKHNIGWREDESNAETKYRRNFVRHKMLPLMEELNPSLLETFGPTWERLFGASELLTHFVDGWLAQHLTVSGPDEILPLGALEELPAQSVVLYEWLQPLGFGYSQVADMVQHLEGISGRYWDSNTHRLIIDRAQLILAPLPTDGHAMPWPIGAEEIGFAEGTLQRELLPSGRDIPTDGNVAWLDPTAMQGKWRVRPWQQGDWFIPLGMKGKKKISDFLIDRKISLNLKSRVWVLEVDDRIAWVIGHRVDERFKYSPMMQSVYQITFRPA